MDIGHPTGMGGAAVPADQAEPPMHDQEGRAFYIVILPDGRATLEQLAPGQAPSGDAQPMEVGDALEQLVQAAEALDRGEEASAFEAGFKATTEPRLRSAS